MKLPTSLNLPVTDNSISALQQVMNKLTRMWADMAIQVNATSEGQIQGAYNALTSPPTTNSYKQGDFIRNSAPIELGTAGSKYVITGWICSVSGTPGTWLQCRSLTGN